MSEIKLYVSPHASVRSLDDMRRFEALGVEQMILPVMAAKIDTLRERAQKAMTRVYG